MSPIIQVMLGMGFGLIAAFFVTYTAIEYSSQRQGNRKRNKSTGKNFFAEPGKRCPICLESMIDPPKITYLNCGHALHDNCLKEWKLYSKNCPECRAMI